MESWRRTWREGFSPLLSIESLEALRDALASGDARLIRGYTVFPMGPSTLLFVEKCCPVAWTGWQGEGLETVGEINDYFARMCAEADKALGEPAACGYFTAAWDNEEISREELLEEVNLALSMRYAEGGALATTG